MLPENNLPDSEIMQTEEVNPAALDEAPLISSSVDIEMTVKEEIVYPVELPDKKNDVFEDCVSKEPSDAHSSGWENPTPTNCQEPVKEQTFKKSFDNIKHPDTLSLDNGAMNKSPNDSSSAFSTLAHSITPITSSSLSQQRSERGKGRGRRRSRWKLKFHHQALPPEYLDHYEASMAQQEAAAAAAAAKSNSVKVENKNKTSGTTAVKPTTSFAVRSVGTDKSDKLDKLVLSSKQCFVKLEHDQMHLDRSSSSSSAVSLLGSNMDQLHILPMDALSITNEDSNCREHDEISIIKERPSLSSGKTQQNNERYIASKGLLGTLLTSTVTSSEIGNKTVQENERKRKSVIISSLGSNYSNNTTECQPSSPGTSNGGKVRNYQDLPYMGEITLDNMKPRRGRKPKKADICHLIYKNYGTVLPGSSLQSNVVDNEEWSQKKSHESSQCNTTVSPLSHSDTRLKPGSVPESSLKYRPFDSHKLGTHISHSDVQNRIISSLLEKRLTAQEGKKAMYSNTYFSSSTSEYERNDENLVNSNQDSWNENCKPTVNITEEPLNLCVKDLNQLKIRLLRKHGNYYEPRTNDVVVKSEPPSPNDTEEQDQCESRSENIAKFLDEKDIDMVNRNQAISQLRNDSENNCASFSFPRTDCSREPTPLHIQPDSNPPSSPSLPGGYIYWPSAGVFVHPMALQSQFLYYQKMGAIPLVPLSSSETQTFLPGPVPHVNLIPHMNPSLPHLSQTNSPKIVLKKEQKTMANKSLIPKAFSMMMDTSPKPSASGSNEVSFSRTKRLPSLGNSSVSGAPTKRKRSAIFIPPMPSENSTNPTTEVSICKFKFTGGAKPSLQEKKMLSVDSGGNFRYYSGTGDKSMRGYEFFPREALQQSGIAGGSSSEQFLAASTIGSSDKIVENPAPVFIPEENKPGHLKHLSGLNDCSMKIHVGSAQSIDTENGLGEGNSQDFEFQPHGGSVKKKLDFLTKARTVSAGECDRFKASTAEDDQSTQAHVRIRRKRRTRKSLAREKLEQTFKEKGFLIQTQQLESAEGATYCKFRQLRKFTRYLFRSWKDYLPGNVREMSVAAGVAGPEASPQSEGGHVESEADGELSCSNSPTPSVQYVSESSKSFSNM